MIVNPQSQAEKDIIILTKLKKLVNLKLKLGAYDINSFFEDINRLGIEVTKDTEQKWNDWFNETTSIIKQNLAEEKPIGTDYNVFENKLTKDKILIPINKESNSNSNNDNIKGEYFSYQKFVSGIQLKVSELKKFFDRETWIFGIVFLYTIIAFIIVRIVDESEKINYLFTSFNPFEADNWQQIVNSYFVFFGIIFAYILRPFFHLLIFLKTLNLNFETTSRNYSKIENMLNPKIILIKKKLLIGLALTTLMLTLTNPTQSDFKYFLNAKDIHESGGRTQYYLIFSVYEYTYYSYERKIEVQYLGIFKNFIEI
jgi:hypothetical protein